MTVPWLLSACAPKGESYDAAVSRTWKLGALKGLEGVILQRELVRYATLAPSSHNTQCWRFALQEQAITILPDLTRRCPAVDPDDINFSSRSAAPPRSRGRAHRSNSS